MAIEVAKAVRAEERNPDFRPLVDMPGDLEWVPVSRIKVDEEYQRGLAQQRAKTMAKHWRWDFVKPITVGLRMERDENVYMAIDGQHTTEAARMRGDIKMLPCYVLIDTTQAREAEIFAEVSNSQRQITTIETHIAMLCAGDPGALDVQAVLDHHGITLSKRRVHGHTQAMGAINEIAGRAKSKKSKLNTAQLDEVLSVIAECWAYHPNAMSSTFLLGVFRMCTVCRIKKASKKLLIKNLKKVDTDQLLIEAKKKMGGSSRASVCALLAKAADGSSTKKIYTTAILLD